MSAKRISASQRAVSNIRKRLRKDMETLAFTHRGCPSARGCGCLVDESLSILERAESLLFAFEVNSYMDPTSPRRIVMSDNSVDTPDGNPSVDESVKVDRG